TTRARRWPGTGSWPSPPGSGPTLPIPTPHGSAAPTRTSTACCGRTSRRTPTSRSSPRRTLTGSLRTSTHGRASATTTQRPTRFSTPCWTKRPTRNMLETALVFPSELESAHSKKRDTFVIEKLEKTLFFLKRISYFYVAEKVFGLSTFFAVDVWVLSFLTFSMIGYVASFIITATSLQVLCVVLAAIRIFEVLIYLIFTMLFAQRKKGTADLRSYRRWLILLVSNYLEIILWFGMFYSILFTAGSLKNHSEHYAIAILRESLAFMVANS